MKQECFPYVINREQLRRIGSLENQVDKGALQIE